VPFLLSNWPCSCWISHFNEKPGGTSLIRAQRAAIGVSQLLGPRQSPRLQLRAYRGKPLIQQSEAGGDGCSGSVPRRPRRIRASRSSRGRTWETSGPRSPSVSSNRPREAAQRPASISRTRNPTMVTTCVYGVGVRRLDHLRPRWRPRVRVRNLQGGVAINHVANGKRT